MAGYIFNIRPEERYLLLFTQIDDICSCLTWFTIFDLVHPDSTIFVLLVHPGWRYLFLFPLLDDIWSCSPCFPLYFSIYSFCSFSPPSSPGLQDIFLYCNTNHTWHGNSVYTRWIKLVLKGVFSILDRGLTTGNFLVAFWWWQFQHI